jgi:hypothetical protein
VYVACLHGVQSGSFGIADSKATTGSSRIEDSGATIADSGATIEDSGATIADSKATIFDSTKRPRIKHFKLFNLIFMTY